MSGWARSALLLAALWAAGCGGDEAADPGGGDAGRASEDAAVAADAAADLGLADQGGSSDLAGADAGGSGDADPGVDVAVPPDAQLPADAADGGAPPPLELALPQAVGGALWANPEVYERVPLRVRTAALDTVLEDVTASLGEQVVVAEPTRDGLEWVAWLPVAGLPDGSLTVQVWARSAAGADAQVEAELVLGRQGVRLSDFDVQGAAGTPRLHRRGEELWLTWTDRSSGSPQAWMRALDGAGRFKGDPVALVAPPATALHARVVFGTDSVGVLYQSLGRPYVNHFVVVDMDGQVRFGPLELDPQGGHGRFGGDVAFDGQGYTMVWRALLPDGREDVRWQRVLEADGRVAGPLVVAESGDEAPVGGFGLFSFVSLETFEDTSLVAFVRGHWSQLLGMSIPKSQLVWIDSQGAVLSEAFLGSSGDMYYHRECRVASAKRGFVVLATAANLASPAEEPPNLVYAVRAGRAPELDPSGRLPAPMFNAVDDRDEPLLLWRQEADSYGVLAWLDHRAYTVDPPNGRIELYTASVDAELQAGPETVFPHARFVAGLSQLHGVSLGSNALLVWLDERHGRGIREPRPELWLETVWF